MSMSWDALGAIGEVVGAGAVVLTLLFLITQLRQNTKSLEDSRRATVSQLYQFRAQMHMDGILRKAETSDLDWFDVSRRLRDDGFDALTEAERMFLIFHATADAVRLDNGLLQHQNGFLDDDYVAYIENSIRLLGPYWRQIGLFQAVTFRPGFIAAVDRICETAAESGRLPFQVASPSG